MTAEEYRQKMIQAFHNADCDELISVCVLPTEKEFEHLEWLLKNHYKKEPCGDAISRTEAIRVASGYCHWSNISKELAKLPSVNPIPCEDAISRAMAIGAFEKRANMDWERLKILEPLLEEIENLPPVSVAEKTQMIDKSNFDEEQYRADLQCAYECGENSGTEKVGRCKDCKWWKDSDGIYRRGSHAESQCPINRKEVFEGNGYCYMYEPQESEE